MNKETKEPPYEKKEEASRGKPTYPDIALISVGAMTIAFLLLLVALAFTDPSHTESEKNDEAPLTELISAKPTEKCHVPVLVQSEDTAPLKENSAYIESKPLGTTPENLQEVQEKMHNPTDGGAQNSLVTNPSECSPDYYSIMSPEGVIIGCVSTY